jgi:hypothetical protein
MWHHPKYYAELKKIRLEHERKRTGGRVGPRATSRERLRAVREQASVDVTPVIRGQWWHFAVIG